jgi:hypothetical protein
MLAQDRGGLLSHLRWLGGMPQEEVMLITGIVVGSLLVGIILGVALVYVALSFVGPMF